MFLTSSQRTATVVPAYKEREVSNDDVGSITPAILSGTLNERPKTTVDDNAETTKINLKANL